MDLVKKLFSISIFLSMSCIYTKGISVTNTTNSPINVSIKFNSKDISTINFYVPESSDNTLMYDVDSEDEDFISLGLTTIEIHSDNCFLIMSRADVEEKLRTRGQWRLVISEAMLQCTALKSPN